MSYRSTTGSGTAIDSEGAEGSPAELDPLGGNVGLSTPYITFAPPIEPEYPSLQPMNEFMPMYVNGQQVTCTLDGMSIGCSAAQSMLESGSAIPAALAPFQNLPGFQFNSAGLGLFTAYIPGYYFSDPGGGSGTDDDPYIFGSYGYQPAQTLSYYFPVSWSPQQQTRQPQVKPDPVAQLRKDFKDFLANKVASACVDALKKAGLWDTVNKLASTAKFVNVDTIAYKPAKDYFGSEAGKMLAGNYFDTYFGSGAKGALTVTSPTVGIYARGNAASLFKGNLYLLLHEIAHLAFPFGGKFDKTDLDEGLARQLKIEENKTYRDNNWSDVITRYFNSGCQNGLGLSDTNPPQ